MNYKSFEQLEKENRKLKILFLLCSMVFVSIIVFLIGTNIDLSNKNNGYQIEHKEKKDV